MADNVMSFKDGITMKNEFGFRSFVGFVEQQQDAKLVTKRWRATSASGDPLGWIQWYSPWRRYVFFPKPDTLYDASCLLDIGAFCKNQTVLRQEERKKK